MKEIKLYGFTKVTCYGNEEHDYDDWFGNSADHFNTIRKAVESDDYATGLEEYIYDDDLSEKVDSIKIAVILKNNKIYSEATVTVTNDFDEDGKDMENLKWYIEGQYSDGWERDLNNTSLMTSGRKKKQNIGMMKQKSMLVTMKMFIILCTSTFMFPVNPI